jgi:transcriptional regulator with XRE-family HTH domain
MKLGDILRQLLDEKMLSQKQLAADLHMAPTTLNNYIRNVREADYETLKRFACYFGVSIDYLLDYHNGEDSCIVEGEMARVFHSLPTGQQETLIAIGKVLQKSSDV